MDAVSLVIVIALIAVLIWLMPIPDPLQKLLYVIAIVCTIFWLLGMLGMVPRLHLPAQ